MATYGQISLKPPVPRASGFGYQAQRNTSGYRDPFPSLSGQQAAPRVNLPSRLSGSAQTSYRMPAPARPPQQGSVLPQAASSSQQQGQVATPQVSYSYDADPVLNQISALSAQDRETATANALALRQQLAQQFGDTSLARQYGGEAQATAAGNNPNSVLAQLAHNYGNAQQTLEQQLNDANLYYSGARVKQLGELANQYQAQQAQAAGQEQGQLNDIATNLAAALHNADLQDAQAQQDAYQRALQYALAAGGAPVASGGGGGGGGNETTYEDIGATPQPITQAMVAAPLPQLQALPTYVGGTANVAPVLDLPDIVSGSANVSPLLAALSSTAKRSSGDSILGRALRG